MKKIIVPLIGTENLDQALELQGARFDVTEVNWPDSFPYAPFCSGRIARTKDSLVVDFRVSGLDWRAQNKQDNGSQWEDSCVEFFVQDPSNGEYYNFEVNPLGKVLACHGASREGRVARPAGEMSQIQRIASATESTSPDGIHSWRVCLVIPFKLIGANPENHPKSLRANFYKCGDKTAHPHFLSWNPIPTPNPDFHRPEYFGELELA